MLVASLVAVLFCGFSLPAQAIFDDGIERFCNSAKGVREVEYIGGVAVMTPVTTTERPLKKHVFKNLPKDLKECRSITCTVQCAVGNSTNSCKKCMAVCGRSIYHQSIDRAPVRWLRANLPVVAMANTRDSYVDFAAMHEEWEECDSDSTITYQDEFNACVKLYWTFKKIDENPDIYGLIQFTEAATCFSRTCTNQCSEMEHREVCQKCLAICGTNAFVAAIDSAPLEWSRLDLPRIRVANLSYVDFYAINDEFQECKKTYKNVRLCATWWIALENFRNDTKHTSPHLRLSILRECYTERCSQECAVDSAACSDCVATCGTEVITGRGVSDVYELPTRLLSGRAAIQFHEIYKETRACVKKYGGELKRQCDGPIDKIIKPLCGPRI